MLTPTCIYCRRTSIDVPFTREHVVQRGFAPFKGALVLHNTVCQECNQYFADTIDLSLTRESVEGLERYRWGVKRPEEVQKFRYRTVTLRAKVDGDFFGAEFQLRPGEGPEGLAAHLVPHVAIHNVEGEDFTTFSEEQITSGKWRESPVDWRRGIKIFGDSASVTRLRDLLAAQGVQPKQFRDLQPPVALGDPITVEQEFQVTRPIQRAIAKIAFNYLAYREGPAFALAPAFDPIRAFVRSDGTLDPPAVNSSWDLPFRTGRSDDVRPVVHFVGLATHETHRNLLGIVLLFGFMTHRVLLAYDYPGPWPALPVAHLYNVRQREVHEMPAQLAPSRRPDQ